MNIILKAFDDYMSKHLVESCIEGLSLETCISIGDAPDQLPDLDEGVEHITLSAQALRAGQYPDVQWSDLKPLDEELIESMQHCEAVFLKMVGRYAIYRDMPYHERKRQYRRHLRYWNHMLEEKQIDLVLMKTIPHQCYDFVLWYLCKLKGIPTLYMSLFFAVDAFSVEESWEEVGKEIGEYTKQLQQQFPDSNVPVPLSPEFEEYFAMYAREQRKPWYMPKNHQHLWHQSFVAKWVKTAVRVIMRKPLYFLGSIISSEFWKRKWRHHKTRKLYDQLAETPDLSVPYIYVPLHMQPEATTCPMGGAYADQELIVELLDACIPDGVKIYVKEHPNQGELFRDVEFYNTMNAIPSVTLVPRTFNSFDLIEHAKAVAAATGTACFEGLFKGKPAMLFGHKYFQYAPGVHRIHSVEDCRRAVESIFQDKECPTLHDMRLFLKAIEEKAGLTYCRASTIRKEEPLEERAKKMGEYVRARVASASL